MTDFSPLAAPPGSDVANGLCPMSLHATEALRLGGINANYFGSAIVDVSDSGLSPGLGSSGRAASVLGIDHRTFKRRLQEPVFYQAWEKGQAVGAVALRQLQWKHAKRPDSSGVAMTIHMSKHRLGEHDKFLHLSLTVEQVDEVIARLEQERAQQPLNIHKDFSHEKSRPSWTANERVDNQSNAGVT